MIRDEFVKKMIETFGGAVVPTSIACFLSANNFGAKLQKRKFWLKVFVAFPLIVKRELLLILIVIFDAWVWDEKNFNHW